MKIIFDLFPLILFFISYKFAGMHQEVAHAFLNEHLGKLVSGGAIPASQAPLIVATIVGIIATVAQVLYLLVRRKKVDGALWVSLVVFLVFGSMTIYFHDGDFIKWKPTVIYWALATAMLVAYRFFDKNLIRVAMEKQVQLPENVWVRLQDGLAQAPGGLRDAEIAGVRGPAGLASGLRRRSAFTPAKP